LKCLSKEPQRRYSSAAALADDLTRFREGRPIHARRIGWGGRLWRWGRRKPTAAGLLAALLALFILTVGGGLWLERKQAERQGRARETVEKALAEVPRLRQQGRWPEAQAVLTQARSRLDEAGSDDLRRRLVQADEHLRLAAELERIRLTPAIEDNRLDFRGMADAYARAFENAGLDVLGEEEAVAARIGASDLRPQLVMALDHWAYLADALRDTRSRERLLSLAQRVDPDPRWGDRFRAPALRENRDRQSRLAAEAQQRLDEGAPDSGPPTPLVALLAKKLGQKDEQAEPLLRAAQERNPEDFWLNFALGEALRDRKPADAVGFYRAALAMRPTSAEVHLGVSFALEHDGQVDEAFRAARKAIELAPNVGALHHRLGLCLQARGQLDEALAEFRRAIEFVPKSAWAHHGLGACLQARGRLDEAMAEFRRAIELDPKGASAHQSLGTCWHDKGRLDEAMAEYRRAIELDPDLGGAHHHLGMYWHDKGQLDQAIAEFRRAIELDPKGGAAHHHLGLCWRDKGRLDLAMAEFHRAIELDPKAPLAHFQLGRCWQDKGQLDLAMAEYRRAIALNPKGAPAHYQLGLCWRARGRLDEAMAEYRRATDLDPGGGAAHEMLAEALLRSGRFTEVRTAVRRAFDLLSAKDPHRLALQEKLNLCERMLALDPRLSAILLGNERPSLEELLGLTHLCEEFGRPRAAAGLYAAVFAARPALADDLGSAIRYKAARAAVRAADEARLGETERAGLRRQALDWLRADLAQGASLRRDGTSGGPRLTTWQTDTDLAAVRDQVPLAKLPATEREEWRRLWADVDASLAADPLVHGRAFAARRDWARAADCYTKAIKGGATSDGHVWFEYAAVLLLSGDKPGYVRACAHMIERCGKAGGPRSYHVARACTLAPEAVALALQAGRLAEKELQASARAFWSLTEQGALAFRAGRFQQAVPFFEQSLEAEPKSGRAVVTWLWLALTSQRLGKAEEARRWLEKAQAWLDQYRDGMPARAEQESGLHFHNWLEAQVLRREAEALIPSAGPRSGPENRERGVAQK
jgi:tetratricopeptide (TPR) repeat protein